jgi:tRNA A-37 threonylcarbamoyl transferase component Bud32
MKFDQIIAVRKNKTIYRDGDRCIKVFNEDFSKADVLNEALNQARIETTGLNIPKVREVTVMDGQWAIVSDFIEGKTLAQLMEETPEKKHEYLELLVDIQLETGAYRVPSLRNTRQKMADAIQTLTEIDASTRYELLQRIHGMERHSKLCHGDLVPSNIVFREDGSYCILDWAHASAGNAGADAAITYLRFSLKDPELAEKYLHLFCRKADMAIQYVQTWMPVVAAQQLTKHKEAERDLLEKWISVAEYQ